jgi:hypothetical protein
MKDDIYQLIVGLLDLFLWGGELVGEENLPRQGPAVFISNHLDTTGPIAAACSIPMRLHPWIIADMMDKVLAPAWMQADFVERQLHLKPPLSNWIARTLCKITVPMFFSLGCIPVYAHDYEQMHETINMSLDLLREGRFILIFPEDNLMPKNPVTMMQPFKHSFVRLGEKYYAQTKECLEFYPVAVHSKGQIIVEKPVLFNPCNSLGQERRRISNLMEDTISTLYLKMDGKKGKEEIGRLALE